MKRSRMDSDDETEYSKKTRTEDKDLSLNIDTNYYTVRRSRPTSSDSPNNLNESNKPNKFDHHKDNKSSDKFNDRFGKTDKYSFSQRYKTTNRFTPFSRSEKNLSQAGKQNNNQEKSIAKSSSTSAINDKVVSSDATSTTFKVSGYNIKIPSCHLDQNKTFQVESSSSGYVIRKSGEGKEEDPKRQFLNLIKSKNLNYKVEYLVRVTIDDRKPVKSTSCSDVQSAEHDVFLKAIRSLEDNAEQMVDESMSETTVDSNYELKQEIRQILRNFDGNLLFKDEIPEQYRKQFKRKIVDNWFDLLQNDFSFKIERHGAGNLVSIKAL